MSLLINMITHPYLGEKIMDYLSEEGLLHLEKNLPEGTFKEIIKDEILDIRVYSADLLKHVQPIGKKIEIINGFLSRRNVIRIEEFVRYAISQPNHYGNKLLNHAICGALNGYDRELIEKYLVPQSFEVCEALMYSIKEGNPSVFRWILQKFKQHLYCEYLGGWVSSVENPEFAKILIEEQGAYWAHHIMLDASRKNNHVIMNYLSENYLPHLDDFYNPPADD